MYAAIADPLVRQCVLVRVLILLLLTYVILFTMFSREFDKISYVGMALSATILLYVVLKYMFNFEYQTLQFISFWGCAGFNHIH